MGSVLRPKASEVGLLSLVLKKKHKQVRFVIDVLVQSVDTENVASRYPRTKERPTMKTRTPTPEDLENFAFHWALDHGAIFIHDVIDYIEAVTGIDRATESSWREYYEAAELACEHAKEALGFRCFKIADGEYVLDVYSKTADHAVRYLNEFSGRETRLINNLPQRSNTMDNKYYSIKELRELLGIPRGTAYLLVQRGDIPAVKVGRSIRIAARDLEAYLAANRVEGVA